MSGGASSGPREAGPGRRLFEGLKVLELGSGAAGPVATRYLAEQGATIVRIESTRRPDFLRVLWLTPESRFGMDGSPMFILLNPGKLSITLDMRRPEGVEVARELVRWADLVSENFAPGPMEKWGLDSESLRRIRPDLIMASCCLFGQTGPHRSYPGFGGQGSALSGFNHMTGWPDRAPQGPHGTITDSLAPRYVALLLVAALLERRRTGRGRTIDLSQVEAAVYSQSEMIARASATGESPVRRGNHHEWAAPHAVYPARGDDRWIAIACFSDEQWRRLREVLGDPEWARDPRFDTEAGRYAHQEELDRQLAEATRGWDRFELAERLQEAGVPAGAVQDYADLLEDPSLAFRGHFQVMEHVHLGPMHFEHAGFRIEGAPPRYDRPGPNLGEHTGHVLRDLLGMSEARIRELEEAGVLR